MRRSRLLPGLYKKCRHLEWDKCRCRWAARYRTVQGVSLARWYGVPQFDSREQIKAALNEFRHQIDQGIFDRRGRAASIVASRAGTDGSNSFSALLDCYRREYVEMKGLRSTSIRPVLAVFESKFSAYSLKQLAEDPVVIEEWLHERRRARAWSNTTFNRYHEIGRALFNWARRKRFVSMNPFEAIDRQDQRGSGRRTEIGEEQERALVEALRKLPMRQQAEMRRRVFVALDCGLRAGEMLRVQRRHVEYGKPEAVWVIELPASVTKAAKPQKVFVGTERLKSELQKRRFLGDDAYVFGTEEGRFVASLDKSWKRLFREAKLPVGRKAGLVWHDLRHEFGIRVAERTDNVADIRDMMRHADIRTSQGYLKSRERRLKELAAKLNGKVS